MTPLVWVNFPLAVLAFLAIVGIPLWMTFRRRETAPDYTEARAHFRAKADSPYAGTAADRPARTGRPAARQPAGSRPMAPGRRHSGAQDAPRVHAPGADQRTRAAAGRRSVPKTDGR